MPWWEVTGLVASIVGATAQVCSLWVQLRQGRQAAARGREQGITYLRVVHTVVHHAGQPWWPDRPAGSSKDQAQRGGDEEAYEQLALAAVGGVLVSLGYLQYRIQVLSVAAGLVLLAVLVTAWQGRRLGGLHVIAGREWRVRTSIVALVFVGAGALLVHLLVSGTPFGPADDVARMFREGGWKALTERFDALSLVAYFGFRLSRSASSSS